MTTGTEIVKRTWQAIALLYVLLAMVMMNHYSREYDKQPSSWVLWYVPYVKGMFWPIVEFGRIGRRTPPAVQKPTPLDTAGESSERAAALKFIEFSNTHHQAQEVLRPWRNTAAEHVPSEVWQQVSVYDQHMLEAGRDRDTEALNRVYPGLGTMFGEKLYKSLELTREAMARKDLAAMREANRIELEWIEWYNPRIPQITVALRKTLERPAQ